MLSYLKVDHRPNLNVPFYREWSFPINQKAVSAFAMKINRSDGIKRI
jgi:hypothetical protein